MTTGEENKLSRAGLTSIWGRDQEDAGCHSLVGSEEAKRAMGWAREFVDSSLIPKQGRLSLPLSDAPNGWMTSIGESEVSGLREGVESF